MGGTELMEEIFGGNFFDQIDDLLEFPNDHVEKELIDNAVAIEYNDFPPVFWSDNSSVLSSANSNSAPDFTAQLSVPYDDIVQFKWLSTSEKCKSSTKDTFRNQFQTSCPISVLDRSNGCYKGIILPINHAKRARSKRPRPTSFNPRSYLIFSQSMKKKRKTKITPSNENPNASQEVRKCLHCEVTKTPQWRAGPMGPKTLCNACGVRYKSGRLLPEYRPAASPTFVPSLHSNSHRKVIEMRNKNDEKNKKS